MKRYKHTPSRRLLTLTALALALTMLLCACGGDAGKETTDPPATTTAPTQEDPIQTTPPTTLPPETTEPPAVNNSDPVWGTVNTDKLDVYQNADASGEAIVKLALNSRVLILQQKTVDGKLWGRIVDGWVLMSGITLDEVTEDPTEPEDSTIPAEGTKATVTAKELNIRQEPDSEAKKVGTYKKGEEVLLLETKGAWGRTDKGWVMLKYLQIGDTPEEDKTDADDTEDEKDEAPEDNRVFTTGKGTVTATELNIRKEPSANASKVGAYKKDDKVEILEVNGFWGRTSKGWIHLNYVKMTDPVYTTGKGTVTATDLNIRKEPSTSAKVVGYYEQGDKIEILEIKGAWGRTNKGWVSMSYVKMDTESTKTYTTGKGTVTADELNIRKEPSADSKRVGAYKEGDKVEILEVNGSWGRTDKGWISLNYVKMDASAYTTGKGTVTATELNIRKEPSASAEAVGSYVKGDKVEILEVQGAWGRTSKGWISLDYVKMS